MPVESPRRLTGDELKQLEAHFGFALPCSGFLVHGGWLVTPTRPIAKAATPKADQVKCEG